VNMVWNDTCDKGRKCADPMLVPRAQKYLVRRSF
jgi:hypothetical protein